MDDEWSALPIDPKTGVKVISIGGSPSPVQAPVFNENPLPIQPQVSADPYSGVTYPTSPEMVDTDQTTGPLAKLFGLAGNERYQTWPEKLVRSAVTAPGDAMAGNISPEEEIPRALDMASLAGGGMLPMKAGEATLGSGMVRKFAEVKKAMEGDSNYVYHATNEERANQIADNGQLGTYKPSDFTDQNVWPDGATNKRNYFTPTAKNTWQFAPEEGKPVLLRIAKGDHPFKQENGTPDLYSTKPVPAEKIQYLGDDGNWQSLLKSDTSDAAGVAALHQSQTAPVFYSAVENAVKDAKLNVGTADQWLGYLKNQPGVKQEELDWTLGDLPTDSKLTKQDVQAHVDANKVQLSETNKLDEGGRDKQLDNIANEQFGLNFDDLSRSRQSAILDKAPDYVSTKFQSYQLPGGTDYFEKILTLPKMDNPSLVRRAQINDRLEAIQDEHDAMDRTVPDTPELFQKRKNLYNESQQLTAEYNKLTGNYHNTDPNFKSSHFPDETNPVVHVRGNTRDVEGNKTLHLEEIQSDWHQKGRAEGYKITPEQKTQLEGLDSRLVNGLDEKDIGNPDMAAVLKTAQEKGVLTAQEAKNYADWSKGENSSIPNAPFKSSWSDLALKRMIRHATENGYDAISWTPGEAQAARYDLSKHVDELWYKPKEQKLEAYKNQSGAFTEPNKVIDESNVKPQDLEKYVGKDVAKKLLESKPTVLGNHTLSGLDLKVGGEGMKAFYDKMLVDKANNIAKKYGGRVEEKTLPPQNTNHYVSEVSLPADRNGVRKYKTTYDVRFKNAQGDERFNANYPTREEAQAAADRMNAKTGDPIHFLKLPQGLKDTAMQKGFPLFSSGFPISAPLQHDPFQHSITPDTNNNSGLDENVTVNGKTIPINNKQDVPDLAGASSNNDTVNIDKAVPRYDAKFKLKNGDLGDIHKYLAIHETEEKAEMNKQIAALGHKPNAEEMHKIYLNAHYGIATPAEHAAIVADGGNPKDYEDVLHGYERKTEHEKSGPIPANLYRQVYGHNQLRGMTLTPVKESPF